MKLTFLDKAVALLIINAGSFSFIRATSSKGASLNKGRGVRHLIDTGSFVEKGVLFDAFNGE